jgi:hypothetical protein
VDQVITGHFIAIGARVPEAAPAELTGAAFRGYGWIPGGPGGPGIEESAPPERHLPLALVLMHGVMAAVTIALVLLTALDVGGS